MYEFEASVKKDIFGEMSFKAKGKPDEVLAGILTLLERLIVQYDFNKEEIIRVWSSMNATKEDFE
jgi:predicted house-cleaning noncanonical NTP pyrophosphatase (MazG superfamily)